MAELELLNTQGLQGLLDSSDRVGIFPRKLVFLEAAHDGLQVIYDAVTLPCGS